MAPKRKSDAGKKIPEGTNRSLKGVKLFFAGSYTTMTQAQALKAVKKCLGTVVDGFHFTEADYVVLGAEATQKRLDEIAEHGIETLTEDDFLRVLKTGELANESAAANGTNRVNGVNGADGEESEDEVDEPAPKKAKTSAVPKKKKTATRDVIPEGMPGVLKGMKLLFTGTFNIGVRETCTATAETYGGTIVAKIDDADWVILGTKPGQNKLDSIENLRLNSMDEDQFLHLLKTGELPEPEDDD